MSRRNIGVEKLRVCMYVRIINDDEGQGKEEKSCRLVAHGYRFQRTVGHYNCPPLEGGVLI